MSDYLAADEAPLPADEVLRPIAEAIERATGVRVHPTTCCRWHRRGVGGVRLRTVVVGQRPKTCEQWVREFIEATTAQREAAGA